MMRRIDALLMIAFAAICLLSGAARAQQRPAESQGLAAEKKILIVYLSRTNNTKAVADIIHEKVGGKLVALELQTLVHLPAWSESSRSDGRNATASLCQAINERY